MGERLGRGEIYTVPVGITVHCADCGVVLEAGIRCYIEDDSSSIYCLKHIPKPRAKSPVVQQVPSVPRRRWAAYD